MNTSTSPWSSQAPSRYAKLDADQLALYHERGYVVAPGSHRGGTLPAEKRGHGHCDLAFEDGRKPLPEAIPCPLGCGDVLLFHADLWHRSLGNGSDKPRRSFIVSYQEATATRGAGSQHKILRPA